MSDHTPDPDVTKAIDALARVLARRRTGGSVYMGGESDPTPGERTAADQYVQDLLDAGWAPPLAAAGRLLPADPGAERRGYDQAIAALRDVDRRTGSPAARWAADYLAADPDRMAPALPADTRPPTWLFQVVRAVALMAEEADCDGDHESGEECHDCAWRQLYEAIPEQVKVAAGVGPWLPVHLPTEEVERG